jgi:hypothetical protein
MYIYAATSICIVITIAMLRPLWSLALDDPRVFFRKRFENRYDGGAGWMARQLDTFQSYP